MGAVHSRDLDGHLSTASAKLEDVVDRLVTTHVRRTVTTEHPSSRTHMPSAGAKLRKAYVNLNYPFVILRFEDGHEIRIAKGKVKTFDAYTGEVIKVVAVFDTSANERDLLESVRAEVLPDAEPHESR